MPNYLQTAGTFGGRRTSNPLVNRYDTNPVGGQQYWQHYAQNNQNPYAGLQGQIGDWTRATGNPNNITASSAWGGAGIGYTPGTIGSPRYNDYMNTFMGDMRSLMQRQGQEAGNRAVSYQRGGYGVQGGKSPYEAALDAALQGVARQYTSTAKGAIDYDTQLGMRDWNAARDAQANALNLLKMEQSLIGQGDAYNRWLAENAGQEYRGNWEREWKAPEEVMRGQQALQALVDQNRARSQQRTASDQTWGFNNMARQIAADTSAGNMRNMMGYPASIVQQWMRTGMG